MAEVENLTIEWMRRLDAKFDRFLAALTSFRRKASLEYRLDSLERRVERIEKRLDLVEV